MSEPDRLARITLNPAIFGGKPIIRGRRQRSSKTVRLLKGSVETRRSVRAGKGGSGADRELECG